MVVLAIPTVLRALFPILQPWPPAKLGEQAMGSISLAWNMAVNAGVAVTPATTPHRVQPRVL